MTAFGSHYPHLYTHRDSADAAACVRTCDRLRPLGTGPVLDLGCGAGRHLPHLAAIGAAGAAMDLSAPLLREAAGVVPPGFGLLRGDMRRLPVRDGSLTAILSLFTAFGYFGPLPAHRGVVAGVARALAPGGAWYLDYLNCRLVRGELAGGVEIAEESEMGPCLVRRRKRLDGKGERVLKDVELRPLPGRRDEADALGVPADGLRYTEQVALFEIEELDALAAQQGLDRVAAAGGYDGSPLRPESSERWLLVYAKRREGEETR